STEPADQATDVATNRKITATFDRDMDATSISVTTFLVTFSGGTPVPGSVSYDAADRTATFTPVGTLAPNTLFTATLTTGIADFPPAPLAAPHVWTFFTGATADVTPPGVLATIPADGAVDVADNRMLVVTFDEPVDAQTVSATT